MSILFGYDHFSNIEITIKDDGKGKRDTSECDKQVKLIEGYLTVNTASGPDPVQSKETDTDLILTKGTYIIGVQVGPTPIDGVTGYGIICGTDPATSWWYKTISTGEGKRYDDPYVQE
jgi:hypothetical protein